MFWNKSPYLINLSDRFGNFLSRISIWLTYIICNNFVTLSDQLQDTRDLESMSFDAYFLLNVLKYEYLARFKHDFLTVFLCDNLGLSDLRLIR